MSEKLFTLVEELDGLIAPNRPKQREKRTGPPVLPFMCKSLRTMHCKNIFDGWHTHYPEDWYINVALAVLQSAWADAIWDGDGMGFSRENDWKERRIAAIEFFLTAEAPPSYKWLPDIYGWSEILNMEGDYVKRCFIYHCSKISPIHKDLIEQVLAAELEPDVPESFWKPKQTNEGK